MNKKTIASVPGAFFFFLVINIITVTTPVLGLAEDCQNMIGGVPSLFDLIKGAAPVALMVAGQPTIGFAASGAIAAFEQLQGSTDPNSACLQEMYSTLSDGFKKLDVMMAEYNANTIAHAEWIAFRAVADAASTLQKYIQMFADKPNNTKLREEVINACKMYPPFDNMNKLRDQLVVYHLMEKVLPDVQYELKAYSKAAKYVLANFLELRVLYLTCYAVQDLYSKKQTQLNQFEMDVNNEIAKGEFLLMATFYDNQLRSDIVKRMSDMKGQENSVQAKSLADFLHEKYDFWQWAVYVGNPYNNGGSGFWMGGNVSFFYEQMEGKDVIVHRTNCTERKTEFVELCLDSYILHKRHGAWCGGDEMRKLDLRYRAECIATFVDPGTFALATEKHDPPGHWAASNKCAMYVINSKNEGKRRKRQLVSAVERDGIFKEDRKLKSKRDVFDDVGDFFSQGLDAILNFVSGAVKGVQGLDPAQKWKQFKSTVEKRGFLKMASPAVAISSLKWDDIKGFFSDPLNAERYEDLADSLKFTFAGDGCDAPEFTYAVLHQ